MKKTLNKPFPAMIDVDKWLLSAFFIGLFVALFLWVFKPFGLSNVQGNFRFVSVSYGVVTFMAILLVQIFAIRLFPGFYNEDKWTVGREITHTLCIILIVALGNLIVSARFGFFELSFFNFIRFLGFALAVGIFPVVIQVLIRQNVYHGRNTRISDRISGSLHQERPSAESVALQNEDNETELTVLYTDLIYLEAADNYVKIFYYRNGRVENHMIRNTMKYFEDTLEQFMFRSHRSYIINLNKVRNVSGNARGYLLYLGDDLPKIPVSRRKLEQFEEAMQAI